MDPFTIIMGVFAAVMGIVTAASTAKANKENTRLAEETREDQQQFSRESANTANANTLTMFEAIDSPKAKVQQLKEAGLSPALIYGQGGAGGSAHVSAQAAQSTQGAPVINPIFGQGFVNEMLEAMKTPSEIENTKAKTNETNKTAMKIEEETKKVAEETKKVIEETKSEVLKQLFTEQQVKTQEWENKWQEASFEDRKKLLHEQVENLTQSTAKMLKEAEKIQKEIDNYDDYIKAVIKNYDAQRTTAYAQAKLANANAKKAEVETELAQATTQAQIDYWKKQGEAIDAEIKYTEGKTDLLSSEKIEKMANAYAAFRKGHKDATDEEVAKWMKENYKEIKEVEGQANRLGWSYTDIPE